MRNAILGAMIVCLAGIFAGISRAAGQSNVERPRPPEARKELMGHLPTPVMPVMNDASFPGSVVERLTPPQVRKELIEQLPMRVVNLPSSAQLEVRMPQTPARKEELRADLPTSVDYIAEEVREALITLPYYSVFDWLEADARSGGAVVLKGMVTQANIKADAEARVRRVKGVETVANNIEVLPVSASDEQLRLTLYLAIYKWSSPLFRYATRALPPIHVVVKNGKVTLKGVVETEIDKESAASAARGVLNRQSVTDELKLELPIP